MKKLFFFAIVALGMTAACQKPDAPVDESNEPVAISFGVQAPTLTVTKTKAAIDETNWSGQKVFVIGYQKNSKTLKFVTDGTVTDQSKISLTGNHFYEGTTLYDFAGLHLGNGDGDPEDITTDNLEIEEDLKLVVEWDGDDDIMIGKTNMTKDLEKSTKDDQGSALVNSTDRLYSAYAARRGIQPTLVFTHLLTRINFEIVYETERASIAANQIEVTELTIQSSTNGTISLSDGQFTVIPEDKEHPSNLVVALDSDKKHGTMMIEPSLKELNINLTLTADALGEGEEHSQNITFSASQIQTEDGQKPEMFAAGSQYTVKIKVYDLKAIEVTASLTDWEEGGSGEYDPDEDWE